MDAERRCICFFFTKEKALKLFQTRAVGSPPFDFVHDQGADVEVKSASKIGEVAGYFVDVRGKAHELQLAFNNFCAELGYKGSTDGSEEWEYLDDSLQCQGPFSKNRIRGWTKAGHLDPAKMMRNTKTDVWTSVQSLLNLDLGLSNPLAPKINDKAAEREDIEEWQISTGWNQAAPAAQGGGWAFGCRGSSEQSENTHSTESANNELAPPPNLTGCSQTRYRSIPAVETARCSSENRRGPPSASTKPSGWGPPPKGPQSMRLAWGNPRSNQTQNPRSREEIAPTYVASEVQEPEQAPSRGRSESSGDYGPNSSPQVIVPPPSQMSTPPPSIERSSESIAPRRESTGWGPQPVAGRTSSVGWGQHIGRNTKPSVQPSGAQERSPVGWGPEPNAVKSLSSAWGPAPTVQNSASGWGSQPRVEETRSIRPVAEPAPSVARSVARSAAPSAAPSLRSIPEGGPPPRSNPTVQQQKSTGWGPEPVKRGTSSLGWGSSQANHTCDEKELVGVPSQHDASDGGQWMSNSNQSKSTPEDNSRAITSQNQYSWAFGGSNQENEQKKDDLLCQDGWRKGPEQGSEDSWGGHEGRGQGFGPRSGYRGRGGGMGWGDDRQNSGYDGGNRWGESGNRSWDDGCNREESWRGRGIGRGVRGRGRGSTNDFGRREGQYGQWESGTEGNPTRSRPERLPGYSYGRVATEILDRLNSAGAACIGSPQGWQELFTQASEILVAGLSPFLKHLLQLEYGEIWSDIVLIRPPWGCADLLRVMAKHWNSVLSPHFSRLVSFQRDELEFLLKKTRRQGSTAEDTLRFISCAKHMLSVVHYPSDEQLEANSPGMEPSKTVTDATKEEIVQILMEARQTAYDLHAQCADRIQELLGDAGYGENLQQTDGWRGNATRNESMGWSDNQTKNPQEEDLGGCQAESVPKAHQGGWGPTLTQTSNQWDSGNQGNDASKDTGCCDRQPSHTPETKSIGWSSTQPDPAPEPKGISWSSAQPSQTPESKSVGIGWVSTQPSQSPKGHQQGKDSKQLESVNDVGTNRLGGGGWGPFKSPAPPVTRGWVENMKPQGSVGSEQSQSGAPDSRPRGWTNNFQSQGGCRDGGTKFNENNLNTSHVENCEVQKHIEEQDGGCRGRGFDDTWNERGSPIRGRSCSRGLWADNPQPEHSSGNYQPYHEAPSEGRWKKAHIDSETPCDGGQRSNALPAETQNDDSCGAGMGQNASLEDPSDALWDLTLEGPEEDSEMDWVWVRGVTVAYPLKGMEGKDVLASIRDAMKGVTTQAKQTGAIEKMTKGERATIKKSIDHLFSVAGALTQIEEEIKNNCGEVSVLKLMLILMKFLLDIYSPEILSGSVIVRLSSNDEDFMQQFQAELEKWAKNSMANKMAQFFRFIGTTLEEMMGSR